MSMTLILKNVKETLSLKFKSSEFVEKSAKFAIFVFSFTFVISNLIAMNFGNKNYVPFLNVVSHLGVNEFNPLYFMFDFASIITGLSLMPFSFYLLHIIKTQTEENRIIKNYKSIRICTHIAFLSSIAANIGFIGCGVFSLDRNFLGIHDYSAGIILLGFTFLTFSMGLLIIRYRVKIPSLFGICGFLTAFIFLFIYMIFIFTNFIIAPVYEWIWLFSVICWTWILIFYVLNKAEFFKNHIFIHTYINERQFRKKKRIKFEFD